MNPFSRYFAAPLLTAIYAFIALFGHGLHAHSGCEGALCETSQLACGCGHSHAPATETDSEPGGTGFKQGGHASEGADCVACALLAQMSVGYGLIDDARVSQPPATHQSLSIVSTISNPASRLADARGPPTQG